LEFTWHCIHEASTREQNTSRLLTVSRSAQGFLIVPLCTKIGQGQTQGLFRFQVWLPDGQRGRHEVAIHARQPFAPYIEFSPLQNPCFATHAAYAPKRTSDAYASTSYKTHQLSSMVSNTGKLLIVQYRTSRLHFRDMTYTVPAKVHHSLVVLPVRLHVNLFLFESSHGLIE
ncbi:hypothetical protein DOTSEDRAFT_102069, partial [Dothistroma septosporum NZE10]